MTTKHRVEEQLRTSWDLPETVHKLEAVVREIDACVPGARTKELMYELVSMVLAYGERLHDLEVRIAAGSVAEQQTLREECMRMDLQKGKRQGKDPI